MNKHRKCNWLDVFDSFNDSGLNQSQFCKQHDLNPKYFNLKLNNHRKETQSAFGPVHVVGTKSQTTSAGFSLTVGRCTIQCPDQTPIESVALLARVLA